MKKILTLICLILCIFSCNKDTSNPGTSLQNQKGGSAQIRFYYLEICPSCDEYKMAEEIKEQLLEGARKGHFPWSSIDLKVENLLTQDQVDEMQNYIDENQLHHNGMSLPLLIVNDQLIVGYEEIKYFCDEILKSDES